MKLSVDYIVDAVDLFEPNGLFFSVILSTEGEIWEELHTQIITHFASFGITLPHHPNATDSAPLRFQQLPWVLLTPGNRMHDGYFSLKWASITGVDFTLRDLKPVSQKLGNPRHKGQLMLNLGECHWAWFLWSLAISYTLWPGPRYGHVKHNLLNAGLQLGLSDSLRAQPHSCFGDRLLAALIPFQVLERDAPACYLGDCLTSDPAVFTAIGVCVLCTILPGQLLITFYLFIYFF